MAQKPETKFKEKVLKELSKLGYFEKIQQVGKRGTPDIIGCIRGRYIALELKRSEKARIDKIQLLKLKEISHKGGGVSLIVYPENWAEILDQLKEFSYP